MSDIVERLRASTGQAGDHGDVQLCDEAADEIERLRGYRDEAEAEASIASLAAQRLRLTDAEREAVRCWRYLTAVIEWTEPMRCCKHLIGP